jgi:uncharacterized protein
VQDLLGYDRMMERAVRGVVREALAVAASRGLPGAHHFYVTFRTQAPGVAVPDHIIAKYPEEMTVVLEHQFWDLEVAEDAFSVTLSFQNKPARLTVPFTAITTFADPSVQFGLQFKQGEVDDQQARASTVAGAERPEAKAKVAGTPGEVVTLDSFRKK